MINGQLRRRFASRQLPGPVTVYCPDITLRIQPGDVIAELEGWRRETCVHGATRKLGIHRSKFAEKQLYGTLVDRDPMHREMEAVVLVR